jgi:glycosyltransferase involved in cell wall biosynthesis
MTERRPHHRPNPLNTPRPHAYGLPTARNGDNADVADPQRRPHVLTLIDVIGHGGAERVAEQLVLQTDPARYRRTVCVTRSLDHLTGGAPEISRRRLEQAGVDVVFLNRSTRLDLRSLWKLSRLLRSRHVDLIHAHKFGSNVWAAVLGRLLNVPVVIAHEHTWSFEGQLLRRLIDRHVVARLCDAVIAVSEADRRRMISTVKMPSRRVVLIPNGIPDDDGRGDPNAIRRELGWGADVPVLVQTAVLRPQKAIEVMLAAMAVLRVRHPAARLLIVGPGDPEPLRAEAVRLGVASVVSFLGPRDDIADILAAADVGVLSSDFEGMPLAVLEYMAAGLPVVATDVGGLPQLIDDGETGFLVPRRDPEALAQRLGMLLDDSSLAARMGERAMAEQHRRFSSDSMGRCVFALYDRLLRFKGVVPGDAVRLRRHPEIETV